MVEMIKPLHTKNAGSIAAQTTVATVIIESDADGMNIRPQATTTNIRCSARHAPRACAVLVSLCDS